jgi:GDP-mannose transporter
MSNHSRSTVAEEQVPLRTVVSDDENSDRDIESNSKSQSDPTSASYDAEADVSSTTKLTVIITYAIAGTALTLVNKLCMIYWPFPNLLLGFQLACTVAFIAVHKSMTNNALNVDGLSLELARIWAPLVLLFFGMLVSSLSALGAVSVATLIVVRNATTLLVAAIDIAWLRNIMSPRAVWCLFGILNGVICYAIEDVTFAVIGYAWLGVNCVCTAGYQIYVKRLIKVHSPSTFTMVYYNNLMSIPLCLAMAVAQGELIGIGILFELPVGKTFVIIISAVLGLLLSATAFYLNKIVTATTLMVINNVNKFLVIGINEVFIQPAMTGLSAFGTIVVFAFAMAYSKSPKSKPPSESQTTEARQQEHKTKTAFIGGIFVTLLIAMMLYAHRVSSHTASATGYADVDD